ncbi:MAG: TRAM domain-containing protein, partial [Clostridia bacterium]
MQKGEILDVKIVGSGMDGEGVAKIDNFVIFIPNTLIDEEVKIEVEQVKKSFAKAKVIKNLKASPFRTKPLCPVFFKCGGCNLQHISYEQQLEAKRQNLIACLNKECKIDVAVDDVIFGKQQFGYRNKIQTPIMRNHNGKVVAGYFKPNSHIQVEFGKLCKLDVENACIEEKNARKSKCCESDINDKCCESEIKNIKTVFCVDAQNIDVDNLGDCPLHSKIFQNLIDAFCDYVEDENLSCYDEYSHKGLVRHFVVRRVENAYAIVVVANGNALPNVQHLVKMLNTVVKNYSLYLCKNTKDTNVILTDDIKVLYGKQQITAEFLGVKVNVSPLSFMQVNDEIRDKIYQKVNKIIENTPNCIVIDAYSGIGILSNIMAKYAQKVYAVEIVKQAIDDADKLALLNNNQDKIVNICGDATEILPNLV